MSKSNLTPICLFVYDRPEHARQTIEALAENTLADQSILHIYADGPKNGEYSGNMHKVREIINMELEKTRFKEIYVYERDNNLGLAASIESGVSEVLLHNSDVIVLEDDVITSPFFLWFMNTALKVYEQSEKIGAISGYNPVRNLRKFYNEDVYLTNRNSSYAWATWRTIWERINFEADFTEMTNNRKQLLKFGNYGYDRIIRLLAHEKKTINSWSIIFGANLFILNKMILYPTDSFVRNIGWDGTGVHKAEGQLKRNRRFNLNLVIDKKDMRFNFPEENEKIKNQFQYLFFGSWWKKTLMRIQLYLRQFVFSAFIFLVK